MDGSRVTDRFLQFLNADSFTSIKLDRTVGKELRFEQFSNTPFSITGILSIDGTSIRYWQSLKASSSILVRYL